MNSKVMSKILTIMITLFLTLICALAFFHSFESTSNKIAWEIGYGSACVFFLGTAIWRFFQK